MEIKIKDKLKIRKITKWLIGVLVLPEIVNAARLVAQSILSGIDQATFLEENIDFPFGEYLKQIDIDWATGGII